MTFAEQCMTLAEHYTILAARLRAKANDEKSPTSKAEWEYLAGCYARLAQQSQSFDDAQHLALGSLP